MKDEERIRCPVHDLISFKRSRDEDVLLWNLIQTQPMQRLRRIKQLGFCEFVYPGATHSRFSHVLGAMHMARRMLDVLAKNQRLGEGENFALDRRATLAAALLHDVGHGPYSHVFEEISDHFQLGRDHESYTLELLDIPEIKDELVKFGVYEQTRRFFTEEPGYSVFNAIISSQMDCDRLDFLCRDRHHTGIRSDAIDLEWLFDSLRIEKVPVDDAGIATEYSFVFSEKGKTVAEEFVIAYIKMYQNVYFHKTTRAVQYLVRDMLIEVLSEHANRPEIQALPIAAFFRDGGQLSTYLQLDDTSILTVAHIAAGSDWGRASKLAQRFLSRDIYKCFELPSTATGNVPRNKLERFRAKLREEEIYFVDDIVSHRSYKQHEVTDTNFLKNILIKAEGEYESLGNVSDFLKAPAPRVARIYLDNKQARDQAMAIFQAC